MTRRRWTTLAQRRGQKEWVAAMPSDDAKAKHIHRNSHDCRRVGLRTATSTATRGNHHRWAAMATVGNSSE
jgi:hypothetical protein